jgi:hypothetical protein
MRLGAWLTRWHRRLATVGVVPLAVWLLSGLAMPFVQYPAVDPLRRLEALPPLGPPVLVHAPPGCVGGLVVERLPVSGVVARCLDGPPLERPLLDSHEAGLVASAYALDAGALQKAWVLETADVWTLPNALQAKLPAWRSAFESGLVVDVSLRTGEVMQVTDGRSRLLAWLGPIPHWLYVTPLRRHRDPWRWVVMATSALALLTVVTGLWNGVRVVVRRGLKSPYQRPALRRHHQWGLVAGVLVVGWCLSGFFSVNPGHLSAGARPSEAHLAAWGTSPGRVTPEDWGACEKVSRPRRLVVRQLGERRTSHCEGPGEEGFGAPVSEGLLIEAAERVVSGPVEGPWLALDVDDPYLTHRHALVVQAGAMRLSADPRTGQLLQVLSNSGRVERWLYQGLHTWNVGWLLEHVAGRRVLQVLGLVLGLGLLSTGVRLLRGRLGVEGASRSRAAPRIRRTTPSP